MRNLTIKETYEEYGQLHEINCELNQEGGSFDGCTCAVKSMVEEIIEYLSYDMKFDNEEQRKTAVKMYLEN